MIIITGATGSLGAQIVEHVLARVPAGRVGVSVRDPERARELADRGVRVRRGDFSEPATLDRAFEGADRVLVVSPDVLGPDGVARSVAAVDAAYRAGAERVLYTGHQAAAPDSLFAPARDHAAVEARLASTGRAWTSLRNGYYATSLLFHLGDAASTGELLAPADGPVAWTTHDDLAEAAAALLVGTDVVDGPTPPLTASEAVDLEQVARTLSELTGRTVRRVVLDDEDFVARRVAAGVPEAMARALLGSYLAARRGEFATADPFLATLLGRPATPVRVTLQGMIGTGTA
ncbi:NAD(P)H-binding protein [Pseudonocardia sp. ICBG601]|uniref:NmrA family NAD(P)-binding protein n=1 Tax=Pseudonocardia sp. ICBG601 TaxID=2846759 RepID=UPI001CF6CFF9|nr:NAD(P)H-binding protein [Pseudonocardia sp. ICBG601]